MDQKLFVTPLGDLYIIPNADLWEKELLALGLELNRFGQRYIWGFPKINTYLLPRVKEFIQQVNAGQISPAQNQMQLENNIQQIEEHLNKDFTPLRLVYYDTYYTIFGDTKGWESELDNLDAQYNPSINGEPGWLIERIGDNIIDINNFVELANAGKIKPFKNRFSAIDNTNMISTKIQTRNYQPIKNYQPKVVYQTVSYTLPKPFIGQRVTIMYEGITLERRITNVYYLDTFVNAFDIEDPLTKQQRRVVAVNGEWLLDLPNLSPQTFIFHPTG